MRFIDSWIKMNPLSPEKFIVKKKFIIIITLEIKKSCQRSVYLEETL